MIESLFEWKGTMLILLTTILNELK
jgi:hypothetical protein